jgi:hypothetical protein
MQAAQSDANGFELVTDDNGIPHMRVHDDEGSNGDASYVQSRSPACCVRLQRCTSAEALQASGCMACNACP